MIYYSLEPWGPERADFNSGIIASTLANIHRDPKRGDLFKPSDFMPRYGEPEPDPDDAKEEDEDGMAPERVMAAMERMMRHQEKVGKQHAG